MLKGSVNYVNGLSMTEFRCEVISSWIVTNNGNEIEISQRFRQGSFSDITGKNDYNSVADPNLIVVSAIVSEAVMEAIDKDPSSVVLWSEAVASQEVTQNGEQVLDYQRASEQPATVLGAPLKQPDSHLSVDDCDELKTALEAKGVDPTVLETFIKPAVRRSHVADKLKEILRESPKAK